MNGLLAQLTDTPIVQGIDCIDCNIVKVATSFNESYQLAYNDLDSSQKKIVDDFIDLIVSLAPSNNS